MPYSATERLVQERAGVADLARRSAGAIRHAIPQGAADLLAAQPFIVVGAPDEGDRMWATVLAGPPGFCRATDERTVVVDALPTPGDALEQALRLAVPVGTITLDLMDRRRVRVNGLSTPVADGNSIAVDEVIGNCPKYIQKRSVSALGSRHTDARPARSRRLTPEHIRLLRASDTFFVATSSAERRVDVSHRGGNAGFINVVDDRHLIWPDYEGNSMFLTLGNLETNPSAGVTFVDWGTGSVLQLTGTATTIWGGADLHEYPGALRLVSFHVGEVVNIPGAMPYTWSDPVYSPFNPGAESD